MFEKKNKARNLDDSINYHMKNRSFALKLITYVLSALSIFFMFLAILQILRDEYILQLIHCCEVHRILIYGLSASVMYMLAIKSRNLIFNRPFFSESFIFLGGVLTLFFNFYLMQIIKVHHHSLLSYAVNSFIFLTLATSLRSKVLWFFALIISGLTFVSICNEVLGIRYGLVAACMYGAALYLLSYMLKKVCFYQTTRVTALCCFFISLFALSFIDIIDEPMRIGGNCTLMLSVVLSICCLLYGFTVGDNTHITLGIIYFLLNVYYKFFAIFWDRLDKASIFAIVGLSLWSIQKSVETLSTLKPTTSADHLHKGVHSSKENSTLPSSRNHKNSMSSLG